MSLLQSLIGRVARKVLQNERTDTDFRPPPGQGRDVISGWRETPRVPGSTQDRTF
jgi:hypothetical protein